MDDICEWTRAVNETTNFRCNEGSISGIQLSKDGLTKIYCCMLNKVNLENTRPTVLQCQAPLSTRL